jgi:cytochrome c-type biogenesis protein CcmH
MVSGARPERLTSAWSAAAVLAVFLLAVAARGQSLDDRVYAVSRQLMCPVCAGQTVAESDAAVAREMRAIIRQKLAAGETPDEILQYFVAQFGDGVLAEPPRHGLSVILYLGPLLALAGGLVIAAVFIRRWTHPAVPRA